MRNNWWGTTSAVDIENKIFHNVDNSSRPTALFQPFLTAAPNRPPVLDDATFSVSEAAPNGTLVATLMGCEFDAGQTISYQIIGGNTGGAFGLNASTGALTVANAAAIDYDTLTQFNLLVRVTDNGSPQRTDDATITVNVLDVPEPEIRVVGSGVEIVDGDASPQLADGTNFGQAPAGSAGVVRVFTVHNDGTAALILSNLQLPSGFSVIDGLAGSIAPGQSDNLSVRMIATVPGVKSGQISFTTNDGNESPFNFSIVGTVTSAAPGTDSFSSRSPISGLLATAVANTSSATKEFNEPNHAGNSGGKSVWWTWTAPANGTVRIDTIGSDFDTLLGVYTGSSVSGLSQVAANDDSVGTASRVSFAVQAGATYQIAVDGKSGAGGNAVLNLAMVGTVEFVGTGGNDTFELNLGTRTAAVNGMSYAMSSDVTGVLFAGLSGSDQLSVIGSAGAESVLLSPGAFVLSSSGVGVTGSAVSIETIIFTGNGGADVASLYDSAGGDSLVATPTQTVLSGPGFRNTVNGVSQVIALANGGGTDRAYLYGSAGTDSFVGRSTGSSFVGSTFQFDIRRFESVLAIGNGGADRATLFDTAGDNKVVARPTGVALFKDDVDLGTLGFSEVTVVGSTGNDLAVFFDSSGDDTFYARPDSATRSGSGFYNRVTNFDFVIARSVNGNDTARLYGSSADDAFVGRLGAAVMSGAGFVYQAEGFDTVIGAGEGGNDMARFYGSSGSDTFTATPTTAQMTGPGYDLRAMDFARMFGFARPG
ncbi:MAG: choice-of-anchor D domain-containing protein, partial [Planctomycetaceae bacterium]|nr:choice-of-anchor D domain-containing protein [Planctomycetaceae bacterium]